MALDDIISALRCPHCGAALTREEGSLRCRSGHSFDVARQGYVTLLAGETPHDGDSTEMLDARGRFLEAGHYEPIAAALAELAADAGVPAGGAVLEPGAGTGYYLAEALKRLGGERPGIAIDISRPAAQRAARAHPRIGSVRADVWAGLPLFKGSVALAISLFSPRNAGELARVIPPGGLLAVATPLPGHLAELVGPLGLIGIEEGKEERLAGSLAPAFTQVEQRTLDFELSLTREDVTDLAAMGPSARHATPAELAARAASLTETTTATAGIGLSLYRR